MLLYTNFINLEIQKKEAKLPENLKSKNPTSIHDLIYKSLEERGTFSLLEYNFTASEIPHFIPSIHMC